MSIRGSGGTSRSVRHEWRWPPVALALAVLASACTGQPTVQGTSPRNETRSPSGAAGGPASSTPPAATDLHGLIAYSTQSGDIWVMNADGSNRRRVTHAGGNDFDPSLSPDGRRIVFRTSRGHFARGPNGAGAEGIFVVNVDGTHEREIQPRHGGLFPDWSPDGRRIALSTIRADLRETIVTMNPDGTHVHDTGVNGECSEWSPDGSRIAYCHLSNVTDERRGERVSGCLVARRHAHRVRIAARRQLRRLRHECGWDRPDTADPGPGPGGS